MGTIIMLALLQASALTGLDQAKTAYQGCVTAETVRLGASNHESAETVLKAVQFRCAPQWQQLQDAFPGGTGVFLAEQARARALAKWRTDAEGAAVAALLDSRASK